LVSGSPKTLKKDVGPKKKKLRHGGDGKVKIKSKEGGYEKKKKICSWELRQKRVPTTRIRAQTVTSAKLASEGVRWERQPGGKIRKGSCFDASVRESTKTRKKKEERHAKMSGAPGLRGGKMGSQFETSRGEIKKNKKKKPRAGKHKVKTQ